MISPLNITQKCPYVDCCNYADSTECIDNYCGCIKRYLNKDEAENPSKSRHKFKTKGIMKKYSKPQMMAKNAPTGSYAAGCPAKGTGGMWGSGGTIWHSACKNCERVK